MASVVIQSGAKLQWTFSANVTLAGTNVTELRNLTLAGSGIPDSATQTAGAVISLHYPSPSSSGQTWQMATSPANLTPSSPAGFVAPESGTLP